MSKWLFAIASSFKKKGKKMKFVHRDSDGSELAIVKLEKNFGNHYFIQQFCGDDNWEKVRAEAWIQLIQDAFNEAKRISADTIQFRLIERSDFVPITQKLKEWGFSKLQERIEYRRNLSELPKEEGTPIVWSALLSLESSSLKEAAELLSIVAEGDPNFDPQADALSELQADLNDSTLTTGTECIHIGCINGEAAAFIFAQVAPKNKWSRITYMGIAPKFRRKGLGKWVHRHGFEMMRNQGGLLYHGGTTTENLSMIHLFELHGCKVYRKMQEWKCKL
jgi:ribosomal protein S18 acetylase RimI-like enzyme